jgi:hypothetical protein
MNRFTKRFCIGCIVLSVLSLAITVSNMTYEDEVSYDEHRAQMEQLWKDSNGEYGWPPVTP